MLVPELGWTACDAGHSIILNVGMYSQIQYNQVIHICEHKYMKFEKAKNNFFHVLIFAYTPPDQIPAYHELSREDANV